MLKKSNIMLILPDKIDVNKQGKCGAQVKHLCFFFGIDIATLLEISILKVFQILNRGYEKEE